MKANTQSSLLSKSEIAKVAGFALAYFLAHLISFFFPDSAKAIMTIWPAGGIGLAALLLSPYKRWPSLLIAFYAAGILADVCLAHRPVVASAGFMFANICESVGCALLIIKINGKNIRFDRVSEVFALILSVVFVNSVTSCMGAGTALICKGVSFGDSWLSWFVSDGLGILIITPLIVTCIKTKDPMMRLRPFRLAEGIVFILFWCFAVWIAFSPSLKSIAIAPHPYILIALLVWPAFRFGQHIVSLALLFLSAITIVHVLHVPEAVPWGNGLLDDKLLSLQIFICFAAVTGYLLSAAYSEAKAAEYASRIDRERLRALGDNIPNGVVYQVKREKNGQIRFIYISAGVERVCGVSVEEVLRDSSALYGLVLEEDRANLFAAEKESVANMSVFNTVIRFRRTDGKIRSMYLSSSPRMQADGCIIWDGIQMDITDHEQTTQALKESQHFITRIMDTTPNLIYIYDVAENRNIYSNREVLKFLGYSSEQIKEFGSSLMQNILHPDDADAVAKHHARFATIGDNEILEIDYRMKQNGGQWRWLRSREVLFSRDEKGRGTQLLGTAEDITESKFYTDKIKEREEKYRNLFNNAEVGMFRTKIDGSEILEFNNKYLEIFGRSREEMQGYATVMHWANPEERGKMIRLMEENGEVINYNCKMLDKQGSVRQCLASVRMYKEQGILEGSIIDISELKQAEEDRARLEAQLHHAQKLESLGVLAGGIAHDFNNLMSGIFGYIDLANGESKEEKSAQYLSKALATIDRARGLTQQLLTFAKGGAPIRQQGNLFPFVMESAQFALSGSNVSCRFDVPENIWPCNFDKNQIGQVVDNLIINAQQAMPAGGIITVTARNCVLSEKEHSLLSKGNYVKVSIQDTGVGIPQEILPRIFDPFFTTKTKGHGLGLATCYSIVNQHGGCIDVVSEPGKGSTFTVWLPASEESVLSTSITPAAKHKGYGTILVMDDEEVILNTVGDMLRSFGYSVECRRNGREAIDFFAQAIRINQKPTAMIFDLTIPGAMGGKEAVMGIRKLDADIPVFVASGYANDLIMMNPADYGFTASISKPFTRKELAGMMEKYVKNEKV